MGKRKEGTTPLPIRVTEKWLINLGNALETISPLGDERVDRSSFIRDLVDIETAMWRKSPYIVSPAHHFLLVTAQGDFFYHRLETLRLNTELAAIPAFLDMKREKRDALRSTIKDKEIKKLWRLNYFALWPDTALEGSPSSWKVDTKGNTRKSVELDCTFPEGSVVVRETAIVLRDYAIFVETEQDEEETESDVEGQLKKATPKQTSDHADIYLDVPTRDLEVLVVVDRELFNNTPGLSDPKAEPRLKFELRNREEAAFSRPDAFEETLRRSFMDRISASYPPAMDKDAYYKETVEQIKVAASRFSSRLSNISMNRPEALADSTDQFEDFRIPAQYAFSRISCNWTHLGLIYSIRWPQPHRPTVEK